MVRKTLSSIISGIIKKSGDSSELCHQKRAGCPNIKIENCLDLEKVEGTPEYGNKEKMHQDCGQ